MVIGAQLMNWKLIIGFFYLFIIKDFQTYIFYSFQIFRWVASKVDSSYFSLIKNGLFD